MSRTVQRIVAAAIVVLVGALAIHYPPSPASATSIQARLQWRADRALRAGDIRWAIVDVRGQRAVITGTAPSREDHTQVVDAVRGISGGGGIVRGGVTRVTDHTSLIERVAPYWFEVAFSPNEPTLISGYAPDVETRDAILARAEEQIGGDVRDGVTIAIGVPDGADWGEAVLFGVDQLSELRRGRFHVSDDTMTLNGVTGAPAHSEHVRDAFEAPPEPFSATANIALTSLEDDVVSLDAITERGACQERFDEALRANAITFRFAEAVIREDSFAVLDRLADTARRCTHFRIRVAGHTDALGDATVNRALSLQRAESVVSYLVAEGVGVERLEAYGLGASEPIADNNSSAGRSRNRRIEFTVLD